MRRPLNSLTYVEYPPHLTRNITDRYQHLTSYPVVSDSIATFKGNAYGAKSIEVADATYSRFGKPVEPYLRTPYSYAAPYIQKADSLADSGLKTVDNHFPIVREETHTIKDTVLSYAFFPVHVAGQSYEYLYNTWSDEYSKTANKNNRGPGITTLVMAAISTELKVASDAFQAIADFLGPAKDDAKAKKDAFVSQAKQKKDGYAAKVQEKSK